MKKRLFSYILVINMAFFTVACASGQTVSEIPETVVTTVDASQGENITKEPVAEEEVEPAKQNVVGMNLLSNGDFSAGSENWGTYITKSGIAEFTVVDGVGTFDIIATGTEDYAVQLYYDEFPLKVGGIYEFSFDISSDMPRIGSARIQLNGGDYKGYVEGTFDITQEMQNYSYTFEMDDTDPLPRLCFNLGTPKEMEPYEEHHKIMIDNIEVKLVDASNIVEEEVVDLSVDCNLNQVGFLPDANKTVVISSAEPGSEFDIVDETGKVVYTGTLSEAFDNTLISGEMVYNGDFSDFTTPGTYKVVCRDGVESYPFTIAEDVYDDLLKDTFRMLYMQRCGMELTTGLAGDFAHPICHSQEAVIYGTDQKKEVSGGWHDAGDYGRYVVPGAQTIQDLFMAYEDYPEIWNGPDADNMDIPESGNGIPDILDEARYELDWMFKMQDETSGGVYHKVTCLDFPEFVMPQEEKYKIHLEETMEKYILQGYGWAEMGSYGLHAYLSLDESLQNPVYVEKIKQMVAEKANRIMGYAQADGYGAAIETYNWGSNLTICSNARQLLFAAKLTGDSKYSNCAYNQLQYILGQNALSYCYVSGYGSLSPVNVHHRPCIVTGTVMKGMVIGGPNANLEDPFAKALLADMPPAKCYLDNNQSFSTNEVTIYWNSPFIYFLSSQM